MGRPAVLWVLLVAAPLLAGCALLGPGDRYDVTVETAAAGHVLVPDTPASDADLFLALTDADAREPVPENRTQARRPAEPGATLTVPEDRDKAIFRLPLDDRGRVTVHVPVGRPANLTVRLVESAPPFPVDESECPHPQKLRSQLVHRRLETDGTIELTFFVVCGDDDG